MPGSGDAVAGPAGSRDSDRPSRRPPTAHRPNRPSPFGGITGAPPGLRPADPVTCRTEGETCPDAGRDRRPRAIRPTERMTTDVSLDLSAGAAPVAVAVPTADGTRRSDPSRAATLHAVGRDLDRLAGALDGPITTVRRSALVGHVGFLVEQVRQADADLATRQSVGLSRLRHESRLWSRDPVRRASLRAAAEVVAAALAEPVTRLSAPPPVSAAAPAATDDDPTPAGPTVRLRELPARRPAALAYRYFWLLDGLPPHLAGGVTQGFTGPARWALRNVLSGGYNRRAYLMWVGGGSGPAL